MKPGRNDPCSCGSGKKYKNCCLGKVDPSPTLQSAPPANELSQLVTLYNTGRHTELESRARSLIELYPDSGLAWKLLGLALHMQGKEALPSLQKAADLLPDDAEAHGNLAAVLRAYGKLDDAVVSGRRAVQINPNFAHAHNNLGVVLKELKQLDEAALSYRHAIKVKPDFAEAHNNLGVALHELWQLGDAVASYRRAIKLKPDFAEAHYNLGGALNDLGQFEEAVASYRRALEIRPDFSDAYSRLLFNLNYATTRTASSSLAEARQYGQMVARKVSTRFTTWQCTPNPKRLRIGMVSGDFRNHPVSYFLESFLAHIDPARIELIAYPTQLKEDALTARIKPHFSAWKPLVGLSDQGAAQLIHADGVHILFDLSGHTANNRLPVFAWKPAPVQVMWLGYFATTGVAEMDYILGDQWLLPDEEAHHFVEKGWRLAGISSCLAPPQEDMNVEALPALRNQFVTFGSLNNLAKMNDQVVACWARLLLAIPASRLYLNTKNLHDDTVRKNVMARYDAHGIAENRLILEATTGREAALKSYNRMDIALDPFPYPGGTSSYEALWMGVPILTMRGSHYISHLGESIVHNVGMDDWIATNDEDYVAKAVGHATNLERLAAVRANLRQQVLASPLFDASRFAKNFEAALWAMWENHQRAQR